MRNLISIGLCCLSFGAFMGCETLSEDPVERQRQIEYYKTEALETIAFISDLVLDGESLADFETRYPEKYAITEYAFNRIISRLKFAGQEETATILQTLWDNLFEEGT